MTPTVDQRHRVHHIVLLLLADDVSLTSSSSPAGCRCCVTESGVTSTSPPPPRPRPPRAARRIHVNPRRRRCRRRRRSTTPRGPCQSSPATPSSIHRPATASATSAVLRISQKPRKIVSVYLVATLGDGSVAIYSSVFADSTQLYIYSSDIQTAILQKSVKKRC